MYSYLLEAREQPILVMLEIIKCKLMNRIFTKRKLAHKWTRQNFPRIQKKLQQMKTWSSNCWLTEAGARKYSVAQRKKLYVVDLDAIKCGCRRWQLSGIPSNHSRSCILKEKKNPTFFVHDCYSLTTYNDAYGHVSTPLNDLHDYNPTRRPPIKPSSCQA